MNDRTKAIAHVSGLIGQYRAKAAQHWLPEAGRRFCQERITTLTREVGEMQAAGPEAEGQARRWCRVSGL